MNFGLVDHAGKAAYLRQKLVEAGHTPATSLDKADVLILDCDWEWAHPRPALIADAHKHEIPVVLYPHGGQPTTFVYDGLTNPDDRVTMRFENGPGAATVASLLDVDLRQQITGWLYSPTRPFQAVKTPQKILFAPLHPNIEALQKGTNGNDPAPAMNQDVYRRLLEIGYDVTVSVVGPLWRNGLWHHPRATIVPNHDMAYPRAWELIEHADVVVAAGTLAAAGVASGKPTVMLGGHDCSDYIGGEYRRASNAKLYEHLFRYPLNCEDGDLRDLIVLACEGTEQTAAWRKLWVGDDGTGEAIRLLDSLVETSSANVTIPGVTAKSGARA